MFKASPSHRKIAASCCVYFFLSAFSPVILAQEIADTPIRQELSKQVQLFDQYTLNLNELSGFYALRDFKPAWKTKTPEDREGLNGFVTTMEDFASEHGLQSDHAPATMIRKLLSKAQDEDAAKVEILITDWLIKIAHDLYGDKVNLGQLYVGWDFKRPKHQITQEMAEAFSQNRIYEYLTSLPPADPEYAKLMKALKNYREIKTNSPWQQIPAGPSIKPGMSDQRVVAVRARLSAEGYNIPPHNEHQDPAVLDDGLKETLIDYQSRNGLEADGTIGAKTVAAMNISPQRRVDQILANMERLRRMPRAYPSRYAIVNIADASLKIFEDNTMAYHAPVVIGRPDRKTPFIDSAIKSIIFNPSWHVPAKIAQQDILPKLRKDPHYLEKMGFVINSDDESDPYGTTVDWNKIEAREFAFRLRQAPGDMNSLGRIKFDFNNNFAVYMHGTPHEELFSKATRTLSSGCIRLKDPEDVAHIVLKQNNEKWEKTDIQGEIDKGRTRWVKVASPLPLYVVYQTVFYPAPDGPVNFRQDVYNYDRILMDAMKNNSVQ